jgi:hypothetical protein
MTESFIQSVDKMSVTSTSKDEYTISLDVSGQFTLNGNETNTITDTDNENTNTVGVGTSESTTTSTSGVTAMPSNAFNYTFSMDGGFTVQRTSSEGILENDQEHIETQTGNAPPPAPTPTPTPPPPAPTPTPTPPPAPTPTPTPPAPTPTPTP